MLSARGISVVVGAENHSSMLGGLGGGFLSLDIWVAEEDSDEAAALLRDLREPGLSGAGFHDDDDLDDADRRDADICRDADDPDDALARSVRVASDAFHLQIDRRRRTGIALLLGCCITFGTAHMFTRAWLRGIALGALELVGILQVAAGHRAGTIAIVGAVAADVIGAVWRVWATPQSVLPEARLHRR
jgi:hypothetical protein